ncbi:MAG: porin family protein [Deferribacteraceae bacterium]|jgi:hypothetical protein|nr:porin family protein [Deferribacteraceae bacterium]
MKRVLVILVVFALTLPAFAMEFDFSLSAPKRVGVFIGPHFGGGSSDTGLNLGVEGDLFVNEHIFLGVALDYISNTSEEKSWIWKYEYDFNSFLATGLGGYRYTFLDKIDVYGSAKFGLAYTSYEYKWRSSYVSYSTDGSDISYALILEGGGRYKITEKFDVGALVKYTILGNTYSHGDIDGFAIAVAAGYSF